ncbi:dipeptide epimerase [Haloarculaceae archaeon H-GB2-1]|nr:dipeptide epimerase [Haloarculaceae archaeon H-GB1-1]MEA5386433.1 dipeptide epimerase [Haloarculaceae archaeon H-GB11]MEA5407945.1 dipeptide epimerase [Haloarculaceae archaeon H-GB2-1]
MTTVDDVRVRPLDLPLAAPFEISLGVRERARNVLVEVETASGTVGYGEGSPLPPVTGETQETVIATVRSLSSLLEAADLRNYRSLVADVRTAQPGMTAAHFALETALLDAYCRERGLALSELFGGPPESIETDLTVPIVSPEVASERAAAAAEEGFDQLKVKTGTSVAADVERVVAVADAVPDAEITVDANQGWTPKETAQFTEAALDRGVDLTMVEQPVSADDLSGLARARERCPVPVAADESVFTATDALAVVRAEAADVINVKLGKSGLLGASAIADVATAANVDLMVGCMTESAVGIHASAHVVAGFGAFEHVDLDGNRLLAEDVVQTPPGPTIDIEGPGHGVVPSVE